MQTSDKGIALIKQFEGCKLTAYQDSVGVWTIGYGWTQPVDGKPIRAGMTIKQETAERLLKTGLVSYESDVSRLVKVGLTQGQFDALVSFTYNLGARSLSTSTLLRKLNAGDYAGAADEFLRWNKAGGKVLNGLTRRREAERALFLEFCKELMPLVLFSFLLLFHLKHSLFFRFFFLSASELPSQIAKDMFPILST